MYDSGWSRVAFERMNQGVVEAEENPPATGSPRWAV